MPDSNLADILLADCTNVVSVGPISQKAIKDQKDHFDIITTPDRTYLIVAAIHNNPIKNNINRISCRNGVPISGYTFDAKDEAYCYECNSYLNLGYIPASFIAKIKDTGWQVRIPMCESVLKRFMTSLQKRELKNFKAHFKPDEYRIEFIQLLAAN